MQNTRSPLTYPGTITMAHDKQRHVYKLLLLTIKSLFHQTPRYLYDTLVFQYHHELTMSLKSENTRRLQISIPNNKFHVGRAYSVIAPRLWNAIPPSIKIVTRLRLRNVRSLSYLDLTNIYFT